MMDNADFRQNFDEAIRRALELAEVDPKGLIPVVEYHGTPNPRPFISIDEALNLLWLSEDRFYRIVDIGVFKDGRSPPVLFVRVSGHAPGPYSDTWDPSDLGPFKQVGPVGRGLG